MKIRIDVGANTGTVSIPWLTDPDVLVYAFEPEPKVFNELMGYVKGNNRYHAYNMAVSSKIGTLDFYVSTDASSSSLLPYDEIGIKKWKAPPNRYHGLKEIIKVETITLKKFMKENNINKVDFLKIDTQGHDLEVLKSAEDRLRDIQELMFEVQITDFELYKNASKLNESLAYMEKMNFKKVKEIFGTNNQEMDITFRNNAF